MAERVDEEALKLGIRLQKYRENAKLTQQDIADATGLTRKYISSIERGLHKCTAQTFFAYAMKCGVSLDELAGFASRCKINKKLVQKISEMTEEEQERALQILELMK